VARRADNRGVAPYPRTLRVNQALRHVVAEELERLSDADERLSLVTVTGVETAPDLRTAIVYCASLPEDADEALAERRPQLQRAVARQVRLKRTPQLSFAVDPAVEAGSRVEEALRRLREAQDSEPGERRGDSEPGAPG
jgi:ribosome-binding factor A